MQPEIEHTRAAYERIAADYAQAQQDRSSMLPLIDRFVSLLPPAGVVLDIGCGPGFDTAVLRQRGLRAIGLDYTYAMLQAGRRELKLRLPVVQADMRHLPLRGDIDGIWCSAALLHLPRSEAPGVLRGFWRALRPGGVLCLSVKRGDGDAWTPISYGHEASRFFAYWQPPALDALLETAAFTLIDGRQTQAGPTTWLTRFARKQTS